MTDEPLAEADKYTVALTALAETADMLQKSWRGFLAGLGVVDEDGQITQKSISSLIEFYAGAKLFRVDVLRRLYEEDENPLYAWEAYRDCQEAGLPVPPWVQEYLKSCADSLLLVKARSDRGERIAKQSEEISVAMKMKKPGVSGAGTAFSRSSTKWIDTALAVFRRMEQGDKQYLAIEYVAKDTGRSQASVGRALARLHALYPEDRRKSETS
ncbi:hypothetical protein [Jiella sp. M17.18]|uniref:hypothetical protein n=1 Tax=Jiella sp. M17.18 TaxID=3234247 RepID=UPI0034DF5004